MSAPEGKKGLDEAMRRIEEARKSNSKALFLSGLELASIPSTVWELSHLEALDLSDNHITAIPNAPGQLRNLRELRLRHNQITAIPDPLAQFANLRVLSLSRNRITAIPDTLAQLANLRVLDLSNNEITAIPDALARLGHLEELYLYSNRITAIPDTLAQLANLRVLYLWGNQISAIPDALARLANLQTLDLSYNQITSIPTSLSRLAKLDKLDLSTNPLPEEVFAALKLGIPSFLRYLESTAIRKVYPRTVKLVLLGEPQSGKTTLLEALQGNPTRCDEPRKETIGINVVTLEKQHPVDHKPMYLSAWDFAGQHMEHATHQFFLTENAIYLILWNSRQGAASGKRDLWYWLELLKMRVRNPKFLLVATHTEHTPPDLNLSEIERSYPGCAGQFPVELSNLKGLDQLQARILELAADSPSLRAEWPPEWLQVRDAVRKIREEEPHLSPAAFRELLKQNGVTDPVAQNDLAGQLHYLGEILYFQEREELSRLVILNPEWVTELIGLVVRSDQARQNGGILSETALGELWEHANLQPEIQGHLVRLMDWFDLTYSTGHATDIGIVVEALPYSTPEELQQISLPQDQRRTEMIFRFPSLQRHLPPGIPTWGIARAHRFRKHKPWRDAAAFKDDDTKSQALLLASDAKKEVRLSVAGDYPPFFFRVMKDILTDTFKRYPGMEPERLFPCPCQPGCDATYLYETVFKRLGDGKADITCPRSGDDVPIESLLSGFRPPTTDKGQHAFESEMRRGITLLLRAQREQLENTCPSVFTLLTSQGFKQLDTWFEWRTKDAELELTLYCEHDTEWHAIRDSVYRFRVDQEWFGTFKEKWADLVRITKYVGPLAKVSGSPPIAGIGALASSIAGLPELSRSPFAEISRELGEKGKPEFVDIETRHLLERLIASLDGRRGATEPTKPKYGGLHREIVEDGRVLWLCPDHARPSRDRGGRASRIANQVEA
ncbi:MAG: leucine-rich repeat domain-containing protein [Candidatus Korobacteraceae bacterium]|jgi:internalin A